MIGWFVGFGTNVCFGARLLEFKHPCIYFKGLLDPDMLVTLPFSVFIVIVVHSCFGTYHTLLL